MIFAGILAGGSGTRMKFTDLPKQFIDLDGKPVIIHTIEKFLMVSEFEKIYVGMNPEWISYFDDVLNKFLRGSLDKIVVVEGGKDRNGTIELINKKIESDYNVTNDDIIVTHDAVRPFVSLNIIKKNIEAMKKYEMVDTVIPAVDTIVESVNGEVISNIPARSQMYSGQTPQTFKIKSYMEAYNQMTDEQKAQLTDACKVFVLNGKEAGIVLGDESNIKLTTVNDLKLAKAILEVM